MYISNKSIKRYIVLVSILFLIVGAVIVASDNRASANASQNLTGWAWSSNIGWVSFNCLNENSCSTVQYNVSKDSSGLLSGYAWSSNIGWISFNQGELSGCPSSPCTASVNQSTKLLEGWTKALSADNNGWDGWISLSGSGGFGSYGPVLDDNNPENSVFEGYAWGSDVVGWLKFDPYLGFGVRFVASSTAYFSLQKSGDITTTPVSGDSTYSGTTTISALSIGGFSDDILFSVTSSTVAGATYSLDGNACSLNVTCDTLTSLQYTTGVPLYIVAPNGSASGIITVSGIGNGFISTVDVLINITSTSPKYDEF